MGPVNSIRSMREDDLLTIPRGRVPNAVTECCRQLRPATVFGNHRSSSDDERV